MPKFQNREEYEKWKTEKSKQSDKKEIHNEQLETKKSTKKWLESSKINILLKNKTTFLIIAPILILLFGISYWVFTQSSREFKKIAKEALKEIEDLDYAFKGGQINYIRFKDHAYNVTNKIAEMETKFADDKKNISKKEAKILGEIITAGELVKIIDCIWNKKIDSLDYYWLDKPLLKIKSCISVDYSSTIDDPYNKKYKKMPYIASFLLINAFYKGKIEPEIDKEVKDPQYLKKLKEKYSIYGTGDYYEEKLIESVYAEYLFDFINFYHTTVRNTQELL